MLTIRQLIGASVWLFADRFLRLGFSFAVGVLVARHFGPSEFGQISFVVAVAGIFGGISSIGLDDIVPREFAKNTFPGITADDIQLTALVLRLVGGGLAYTLLLCVVWVIEGLTLIFWIALVLGPYFLLQATDIYEYRLRVDGRYAAIAKTRTLSSVVANVLKVLVVALTWPITVLAMAMTVEYGVNAGIFNWIARNSPQWGRGRFRADYARHLIGCSWKIILAGLFVMLQSRIEYFLIEHYLGWENVGQYAAALKVVELFDVLTVILITVLLPELTRKYAESPVRTRRQAYFFGCLSLVLLVPGMLLAIWIFPWAYGERFNAAAMVLPIFMLRPIFVMLTSVRNMLLVIEHRFWYPPIYAGIGALASFCLGFWLIPTYGLFGAVLTAILSLFVSSVMADLFVNRKNLHDLLSCWQEIPLLYRKLRRA